jgi:hypothetical protein
VFEMKKTYYTYSAFEDDILNIKYYIFQGKE